MKFGKNSPMVKPTYQDADLLFRLFAMYDERRSDTNWVLYECQFKDHADFMAKHPAGSKGYTHVAKASGVFELIGTLLKFDLIHEDFLFHAFTSPQPLWEKVKSLVYGERKRLKTIDLFENFEYIYNRHKQWFRKHKPRYK